MMQPLAMIAAIARAEGRERQGLLNGHAVLGRDNALPWHHPEDLRYFKRTTLGHAVIQGRKTYESVGKPLPGRRNLVVTRDPSFRAPGCEVFTTPEAAVEAARQTDPLPFVLGGEAIYRALLPLATIVYLTFIDEQHDGDAFFPELDAGQWREAERQAGEDPALQFVRYERIQVTER